MLSLETGIEQLVRIELQTCRIDDLVSELSELGRALALRIPSDPEMGMNLDALEALLTGGERPALVYAIPEGTTRGHQHAAPNRRRLAELAARYGVPVIEDDAYHTQ